MFSRFNDLSQNCERMDFIKIGVANFSKSAIFWNYSLISKGKGANKALISHLN